MSDELDPRLFTEDQIRLLTGQPSFGSRVVRRVVWLCLASGVIGGVVGATIVSLIS
jgi:hypothetical protein